MLKIKIKDKNTQDIELSLEKSLTSDEMDLIKLSSTSFHFLTNLKSYSIDIIKFNKELRQLKLKVDNKVYDITISDKTEVLLNQIGLDTSSINKISELKAPMPGLILDIKVKDGDKIKAGDKLIVLEAMKMENILYAPSDGVIKKVLTKIGDNVEKQQKLLEFD